MIDFPPHQARLVRRESEKVFTDMVIHGCGFYDEKGNYIPWAKVMINPKETPR